MPPTTGARSAFMTSRTHAGFLENGNEAGKDDGDRQGTGKWHLPGPESDPVTAAGWLERAEPKDRFLSAQGPSTCFVKRSESFAQPVFF
jgi:hypothetical protein